MVVSLQCSLGGTASNVSRIFQTSEFGASSIRQGNGNVEFLDEAGPAGAVIDRVNGLCVAA